MATVSPYENVKRAACLPLSTTGGQPESVGRDDQNRRRARFFAFAQGCIEERVA